jgi:hypothetical protein
LMAFWEAVQTPWSLCHQIYKGCRSQVFSWQWNTAGKSTISWQFCKTSGSFSGNNMSKCLHKMELRHLEDHQAHWECALINCPQCQLNTHIFKDCWRQVSYLKFAVPMAFEDKEIHDHNCPLQMSSVRAAPCFLWNKCLIIMI